MEELSVFCSLHLGGGLNIEIYCTSNVDNKSDTTTLHAVYPIHSELYIKKCAKNLGDKISVSFKTMVANKEFVIATSPHVCLNQLSENINDRLVIHSSACIGDFAINHDLYPMMIYFHQNEDGEFVISDVYFSLPNLIAKKWGNNILVYRMQMFVS